MREALLELRILMVLDHPNIVSFKGCAAHFPEGESPYVGLVFEKCGKGSLAKLLHENKTKYPFEEKLRIVSAPFMCTLASFCSARMS